MLLSILSNLISNGIKYSHKGDKIAVSSETKKDEVIVEIKDDGIGIIKDKLFTPQITTISDT